MLFTLGVTSYFDIYRELLSFIIVQRYAAASAAYLAAARSRRRILIAMR